MDVAASAHAVDETDARSEHRRAAEKITVRPHRLAHGLHSKPKALNTRDRRIVGLDAFDMLFFKLDVVFQTITHEVHLEVGDTPIFLHIPNTIGDMRSRPGMGVIKIGIRHDPVRHFLNFYDHFTILIVQEVFGVGFANFGSGIAPEPMMDVEDVAKAVLYMASLPLSANVQFMTVMATKMPFVGRG